MSSFSHVATDLAFAQLWQVTLVIVGAGLITRLGCRRRPHLAHLIWLVVLVKCLTPPLWSSPTGVFSWTMPRVTVAAHVAPDVTTSSAPSKMTSLGPLSAADNDRIVDGPAKDATSAVPRTAERPSPASPIPASLPASSWTAGRVARWLGIGWAMGALAYAGFALLMIIGTWRTIRASQVPCDEALSALLQTLAERLRVGPRSRLVLLSEPLGPMTFGWIRPTIVVPQALVAGRSAGDLEPLLAHELVHIRRGDAAVGLLQVAAQCVWWFHPLVWWAGRQMGRERERCCDEEVIAGLAFPAARYARSLVDVLELKRQLRWLRPLPGLRRFEVTKQRLEHVMRHSAGFRQRMPRSYWLLLLAGVLLLAPGARLANSTEGPGARPATTDRSAADRESAAVNLARSGDNAVPDSRATAMVKRVYDSFAWIEQARSLHIRTEFTVRTTAEAMRWQESHPLRIAGQVQHLDPRAHRQNSEWAWDNSHVRYWQQVHHDGETIDSLETRTWDGSLSVVFDERSDHTERSYVLDKKFNDFWAHRQVTLQLSLPWGPGGPYHFWWLPEDVALYRAGMGLAPDDFKLVGEETISGRPCHVVESRIGGYRMAIGVADGRLYDRTGPLPFGQHQGPPPTEALQKVAGPDIKTYEQWQKWLNTLNPAEQGRAAHRYLVALAEGSPPIRAKFHQTFDDFREVTPGRWLPFRQSLDLFNLEAPEPFVEPHLEQSVTEVVVDRPLSKDLFQIKLEEGAAVTTDRRYDPAIRYTYRKDQTEAERIALSDAERATRAKRSKALEKHPTVLAQAEQRATTKTPARESPWPVLIETSPKRGETGVSADLKEIRVTFDRDMGKGMSWTGGEPYFPDADPSRQPRWITVRTCVLPVKLAAGHFYRVGINSTSHQNFRSGRGIAAPPAAVYFTTAGATNEVQSLLRVPQIVALEPANGAADVDPATTALRVTFDVPMGKGMSWTGSGPNFPKIAAGSHPSWSSDGKTCTFPVSLEPAHSYRLGLNSVSHINFQSASGVPLEPVRYRFKTR